jgi:hypothetical protein
MLTPIFCLAGVLLPIVGISLGIGFLARERSKLVQIFAAILAIMTAVITFVSVNAIGFGVYYFYAFDLRSICDRETIPARACMEYAESERELFQARLPTMMLWSVVPEIMRPPCQESSPEFCLMGRFGLIKLGGWGALLSGLAGIGATVWSIRRRKKPTLTLFPSD